MSTRSCIIIQGENKKNDVILYHHWDGYPSGVGQQLVAHILKNKNGFWFPEEVANDLIKDKDNLDIYRQDDGFELTTCIHGDIEFLYVYNCTHDNMSVKCYSWYQFNGVTKQNYRKFLSTKQTVFDFHPDKVSSMNIRGLFLELSEEDIKHIVFCCYNTDEFAYSLAKNCTTLMEFAKSQEKYTQDIVHSSDNLDDFIRFSMSLCKDNENKAKKFAEELMAETTDNKLFLLKTAANVIERVTREDIFDKLAPLHNKPVFISMVYSNYAERYSNLNV